MINFTINFNCNNKKIEEIIMNAEENNNEKFNLERELIDLINIIEKWSKSNSKNYFNV